MKHRLFATALVLLLTLACQPTWAQESVECRATFNVRATGSSATFRQQFVFGEGTSSFPDLPSGPLTIGGEAVEIITRLVPVQIPRTQTYYVVVFVNGRPRLEQRVRTVYETTFVEVQEERQIQLPEAVGRWKAVDLCLFSTWNVFHVGQEGVAIGAGTTFGQSLQGAVLYWGVEAIPSGIYQLSTEGIGSGGPVE